MTDLSHGRDCFLTISPLQCFTCSKDNILGMQNPCLHVSTATSRNRRRRQAGACVSGQATIEFVGVFPLLALSALACVQGFLLGLTVVFAQAAADTASRSTEPARLAASELPVPAAWRRGTTIRIDGQQITVRLQAPTVLPGVRSSWLVVQSATERRP